VLEMEKQGLRCGSPLGVSLTAQMLEIVDRLGD
jgi:hypothetical protein